MILITIFPHTANVSVNGSFVAHIEYSSYNTSDNLITFFVNGSVSCYFFYDKLESMGVEINV